MNRKAEWASLFSISALLSLWQISKISSKKGKRDSFDFVMTLQWEIQEHFGEVV